MKPHETLEQIKPHAEQWVAGILNDHKISGHFELTMVREMAWSLVAKVTHNQGVWYFKYLPEYFAHELPITHFMSNLQSPFVGGFIAMDVDQRFLLVEDAGPMLRDRFETERNEGLWYDALERYAALQIQLMNDQRVKNLPLPNRSLGRLPELVLPHVDWAMSLNGDDPEDRFREIDKSILLNAFEHWEARCEALYQFGLVDCLNHGDFHDGNIAYRDKPVLFDWGDASLSHPFTCMRTVLVSVNNRFELNDDEEKLKPFIEAYLKPWQAYASTDELMDIFQGVRKTWALVTFLSWKRGLTNLTDDRGKPYHYALPALLREFTDAQ